MPARIVVTTGPHAGKEFPLEKNVVRIGSSASCEVCLPGGNVEAHALTVRFEGGNYKVYNRSNAGVTIGSHSVPASGSADWPIGEEIQIDSIGDLRLLAEGDVAPRRRAVQAAATSIEPEYASEVEDTENELTGGAAVQPPPAKSQTLQWVVIGCCLVAVLMLFGTKLTEGPAGAAKGPAISKQKLFDELDERSRKNAEAGVVDVEFDRIHSAMRAAYRFERSGDRNSAAQQYTRVLRILAAQLSGKIDPSQASSASATADEGQISQMAELFDDKLYGKIYLYISQWK